MFKTPVYKDIRIKQSNYLSNTSKEISSKYRQTITSIMSFNNDVERLHLYVHKETECQ